VRLKLIVCVLLLFSTHAVSEKVDFTASEKALLGAFTPWPMTVPADPGNEYSGQLWAERLGAQLFNDAALSADQSISCASCHQSKHGLTDAIALPTAGAKPHVRNTQGLLNVGYQRWFGWDGGADSLWSASLRPMLSEIEMASDINTLALRLRNTDYFSSELDRNNIELAKLDDESVVVLVGKFIGAYMRTLVSGETSFDRFVSSLLSEGKAQSPYSLSAQRGMKIFFGEGNCFTCHFGANPGRFAGIKRINNDPYNLTGRFNGTKADTETQKTRTVKLGQVNFGQWRTPSLRNLSLTAPYMHDGSLETLRDVVDYYADIDPTRLHGKGESILKPFQWSVSEREDLVAFLETLSE